MKKIILSTLLMLGMTHTAHADDGLSQMNNMVCQVVQESTKHVLIRHHQGQSQDDIRQELREVALKVMSDVLKADTDDDVKVAQFFISSVGITRMSPILEKLDGLPAGKTTNDEAFLKKTHADCLTKEKELPNEITGIMELFEQANGK